MAITREFKYREWEGVGVMGLIPTWFEGADPTDGRGVAHDLLEHFKGDETPTEGELLALGSFLLLRGETGVVQSAYRPLMGGDLQAVMVEMVENHYPVPRLFLTRALPEFAEGMLQDALDHAYQDVETELKERLSEEVAKEHIEQLRAARPAFTSWVRRGYRKAQTRYKGCDTFTVGEYLFSRVQKLVDSLVRSGHLWPEAKVRISADPRRMNTWARVWDPDSCRWVDGELFC